MAAGVLALLLCPAAASAANFPAACSGTTGNVASLRAAITQANSASGPDSVSLGRGCTYTITQRILDQNDWYGFNGLPVVASAITVEGNGGTIQRSAAVTDSFRFFFVGADPAAVRTAGYTTPGAGSLTLRNVTLRGGRVEGGDSAPGGGGAGMGGAIFSQGQLVIENSTLVGNAADGGDGNTSASFGGGGGGMGTSAATGAPGGGSMGNIGTPAKSDGGSFAPAPGGGAGGGGGFTPTDDGVTATDPQGTAGGGTANGMGGAGAAGAGGAAGNGSGGGGDGDGLAPSIGGEGGDFGQGGFGRVSGGGGGVGGGGASGGGAIAATGGGGGFGGGGGNGTSSGGAGGFGGGAGARGGSGSNGAQGFGGGVALNSPGRGGGGAGFGGAVFNMQGTVTIRNSTLTANSATGGETALSVSPDPGKGLGGAVFNMNGPFTAVGSTIAGNTAAPDIAGVPEGTAVYNLGYDSATAKPALATLRNTIVGRGPGSEDLVSNKSTFIFPMPNLSDATAAVGERNIVQTRTTVDGGTITGTPLTSDPAAGCAGEQRRAYADDGARPEQPGGGRRRCVRAHHGPARPRRVRSTSAPSPTPRTAPTSARSSCRSPGRRPPAAVAAAPQPRLHLPGAPAAPPRSWEPRATT